MFETLCWLLYIITHFHSYLYSHSVTFHTDNSAAKATLMTPNPSGKDAYWWTKVYEAGVKDIHIVHLAGKLKLNVSVLSKSPQVTARTMSIGVSKVEVSSVRPSKGSDNLSIPGLLETSSVTQETQPTQYRLQSIRRKTHLCRR